MSYPPGVCESDIPGLTPEDEAWEEFLCWCDRNDVPDDDERALRFLEWVEEQP
jgi:hypothetical protein